MYNLVKHVELAQEFIMQLVIVFSFCILYSFALADRGDYDEELDVKLYQKELAGGDPSEFLSSNAHHREPRFYKDYGRRFVPVYPYTERKSKKNKKVDPEEILQFIQSQKEAKNDADREIIPIRAPKEVVLAVMNNAVRSYAPQPSDPTEEVIRQYMLRSGDYWDGVWKEEVNPDSVLRTNKKYRLRKKTKSKPVAARVQPGTKLYDTIAALVKHSPKVVYVVDK